MEILNFKGSLSDLIYILKKGGSIHIKKKNRGKFTDYCGGKVTEECITKGKKSKDPKIREREAFADNAGKWKHESGNILKYQNPNSPLLKPWKALEKMNYEAIPDSTFTRDKTGMGSIEYFSADNNNGITYLNGYHKVHPKPGTDVILYDPATNDQQDVRLDALHFMPKDPVYGALYDKYLLAARDGDVAHNADRLLQEYINSDKLEQAFKTYDVKDINGLWERLFLNEADGLLRNMFIEGTPEYIKGKRYYPDKAQLERWNAHLMPYINDIKTYLETGIKPEHVIEPAVVTAYKKGGSINIKKKNRGKFTEYCGGKVTEECIARGKKSKDPKIRKRATFADNARKWKHATGGPIRRPNFKESKEAYYDPETDTIFAPDSLGEFYHHEMFHARPNTQLLESLKPYYHNLNDDVLKQMGADLSFVKRFNNDPGHFYSPEELGARVVSAYELLNRMGIKDVTLDFLKNARLNENAYGDNFRDLIHMYNDENLIKIFNTVKKHKKGGILKAQKGTTKNFWSKLWNSAKEGAVAARDARIGAVGAQQIRDLYSEGKNQEAQDLAKQYAKANVTGIALAGGAASTSLLGDLMVTGATTAADTFIDGNIDNFGKNLSLNAAFDLAGHGIGKLLRNVDWGKVRNVGKKISNFLDKDLFNYDDVLMKIKRPTYQKYYHGSPKPFDINNPWMGTGNDAGIHASDRYSVAKHFTEGSKDGVIYEFWAPKPSREFIDLHSNGLEMFTPFNFYKTDFDTKRSFHDGTKDSKMLFNVLNNEGGSGTVKMIDPKDSQFSNPPEYYKPFDITKDLTIDMGKIHWPDMPTSVQTKIIELNQLYPRYSKTKIRISPEEWQKRAEINTEVSKLLAENEIPVVKYANTGYGEGGGMSYMIFDKSKMHVINPDHQFKMKHALTGLGTGLGVGYGVSQVKDE